MRLTTTRSLPQMSAAATPAVRFPHRTTDACGAAYFTQNYAGLPPLVSAA